MKIRPGLLLLFALTSIAGAEEPRKRTAFDDTKWQRGPTEASLAGVAQLKVPGGFLFADAADTKRLMEEMQNPTSGQECGFLAPESMDWFAVFEYDPTGYVKDDEKNNLDADGILKSIRNATEESNKLRRSKGWNALNITGWHTKPSYNAATHNLEWAITGESEGHEVINYQTRILGRGGVMKVILVATPTDLTKAMPQYRTLLGQFSYKPGSNYAEFKPGDKIAKYGLSALVVGGAAAVAAKTGIFKWLGKALIAAAVAVSAFVKKLFGKKKTDTATG
jgi:uncharacterized membrane-anchored protein